MKDDAARIPLDDQLYRDQRRCGPDHADACRHAATEDHDMRRLCCITSIGIVLALALDLPAGTEGQAIPQPWGSWVWSTYTPAAAALPALVTFHEDGTVA